MIRVIMVFLLISLVGCANQPFARDPIVDMRGVDPNLYRTDLAECNGYAEQVAVGARAGQGAVAGAVIGGLVGAAIGNSNTAQRSAGAGAVVGGARGGADGMRERDRVIKNCLRLRGYAVLN